MIEREHPTLSIGAQCRLLSSSRSSFYHEPAGEMEMNLGLLRLLDRQSLDTPLYGVQQMTWHLQNEGHRPLDHLQQPSATSYCPWRAAARRGLLAQN